MGTCRHENAFFVVFDMWQIIGAPTKTELLFHLIDAEEEKINYAFAMFGRPGVSQYLSPPPDILRSRSDSPETSHYRQIRHE